ncbi:tyrosine-type recombinase/integrase [Actinomadura graeca]|uniref:Tyrosine-type recombinase/integrase n=1 Tax=Actinomadura graeca TaxID=2750812 RepID=A0ABX8R731_9ACTN|nr:tyrosine-type recombinase/integrase [Actinomadura graeca]
MAGGKTSVLDLFSQVIAYLKIAGPSGPLDHRPPSAGGSAPVQHRHLHDLRHIHATTLLLAGVPVHVVAARLGHADPSITLRVYAHVINQQLVEAAEIFAKRVEDVA